MSTPSITSATRPAAFDDYSPRTPLSERTARLIRGNTADPAWSRPSLLVITLLASILTVWGLTRNGYANVYYSEAVQAASHSWKALVTNAEDLSGFVSLDKGPLSIWMMGLSGRIFGFSSLSMLLPNAACGVASVLVLHNVVKRTLGHRAAVLAALMLALSPVAVAVSRFNNPDALLVLTVVCAAWALVRALESGRTRDAMLSGALVGLAFNTKMLEAYLVVPGLALALMVAGQGSVLRRVGQLLAAGAAMALVSFAWFTTMMLLPSADRPWVGDTQHNSWFELILGANGLSRVSGSGGGPGGGGGFGGSAGALRLFNSAVGAQIAWLLPLAAVGLVTGLWLRRRAPRTDPHRTAYLLWGTWALVSFAIFSFSSGIFHPYYTSLLAPAVAVLCAGGLVSLWDARRSSWAGLVLTGAIAATGALSFVLLERTPGFLPALRWLILGAAALSVAAPMILRLAVPAIRRRLLGVVTAVGLAGVLAGPGAYAIATVGHPTTGSNPLGGPSSISHGGPGSPGGLPGRGRGFAGSPPPGLLFGGGPNGGPNGGPPPGASASNGSRGFPALGNGLSAPGSGPGGGPGSGGRGTSKELLSYLQAHRGTAKYLVAATGSQTAGAIALATNQPVVTIGGFMGGDPAPTATQLAALARSGQLRYVLLDGRGGPGFGGARTGSSALARWVTSHGTAVNYSSSGKAVGGGQVLYELTKVN
ncbi:MAG TPA: glycosyltransferase family 39 protein [Solirubrobacteraceae bacterium]|jgi:4-amino-4-deoxy-L-arabinose transferase-like glycosyltransferase